MAVLMATPLEAGTRCLAVEVDGIGKRYGDRTVLDGIGFSVTEGSITALLGHNGAGKTTLVRILATLLAADSGTARICGLDLARQPARIREQIAVVGQEAAVDELLTGRQNLRLVARLRHLRPRATITDQVALLLGRFGLEESADRPVAAYSGGMRRRLDLAVCLLTSPRVLFLDEPTTGVDPVTRAELWHAVRELADAGTAILLTTQYLAEADELADDVVILADGRMVAHGSPARLKEVAGGERVVIELGLAADWGRALSVLAADCPRLTCDERRLLIEFEATEPLAQLGAATGALARAQIRVSQLSLRGPTLDDVFLDLAVTDKGGSR